MKTDFHHEQSEQHFCAFIACLGSLIIGSTIAWTAPGLEILENPNFGPPFLVETKQQELWISSWMLIGAVLGAFPAGALASLIGRKLTLLFSTIVCLGAWIAMSLATNIFTLYVTRFVSGIIVGIYSVVIPMYVTEIAEDPVRGTLGTYIHLFTTVGILLDHVLGITNSYGILCSVITTIVAFFLFSQLLLPESPTYLVANGRKEDAIYSLKRLRGPHNSVELEIEELQIQLQKITNHDYSLFDIFTKVNLKSLLISITLMILQQFCGISIEFIFTSSETSSGTLCTIILGCLQPLATIIATIFVDKIGRKVLLGTSGAITSAALFALGFYFWLSEYSADTISVRWIVLIALIAYIVSFSIGLGPIPWILVPEILAPEIKTIGIGFAVGCNWLCYSLLSNYFQFIADIVTTMGIFWLLAAISALSVLFALFVVPETRKKSLQRVHDRLAGLKSSRYGLPK